MHFLKIYFGYRIFDNKDCTPLDWSFGVYTPSPEKEMAMASNSPAGIKSKKIRTNGGSPCFRPGILGPRRTHAAFQRHPGAPFARKTFEDGRILSSLLVK
jgi:hypothetical protein